MTPKQWAELKHFHPGEKWGNPSQMQFSLLSRLDRARAHIGHPFIITSGNQGVHSKNSLHYTGRAVDFVVMRPKDVTLCDVLLSLLRFDFTGVGIYPHWKPSGGFHLEFSGERGSIRKLWMGIYEKTESGDRIQTYHALTVENLAKHGAFLKISKRGNA